MKNSLLLLSLLCLTEFSAAQNDSLHYFFVYFKDKSGSTYSIDKPLDFLSHKSIERRKLKNIPITEKDFPVNREFMKSLGAVNGIRLINSSRWMNAAEICSETYEDILQKLSALPFVLKTEYLGRKKIDLPEPVIPDAEYRKKADELRELKHQSDPKTFNSSLYGQSFRQNNLIGIPDLHKLGNGGKGLHIACMDAGFHKAYRIRGMEDLLDSQTVIRDFVDYDGSVWEDDQHGSNVLGFMKTFQPGTYIGTAPFATYTLLRTEDARSETPTEEANWLFAAEFADSLGVDIIAASVGYHNFDDASLSYTHSDLDGKSSLIARAANEAAARGIAVICSAGNEGNGRWKKTGTPADAFGVIAIGACDDKGFHAGFSSYGPSADGRVKPEFIAPGQRVSIASAFGTYAGNGTSYSSPLFAGAYACLMQMFPSKTQTELMAALRFSATHCLQPDSAYGYGLPDFALAAEYLKKTNQNTDSAIQHSDLYWYRGETGTYFQQLNLYFRSGRTQQVLISVKGRKGNKEKNLYRKKYKLRQGEWLHEDILMQLAKTGGRRSKRYRDLRLSLKCAGSEYERRIRI